MVYKWCIVPQCTNTSIKHPDKIFVSVPTKPERRDVWLQLAGRDPKSILSHTNVFMCEDHFDMENDTINYMQYKTGFSQRIFLAKEAAPTKFHCQEDRKRQLPDAESPQCEVILKRQRLELITGCLQSYITETHAGSSQKHINMIQEIIEPEDAMNSGNPTLEMEYYKDLLRCFVPSCKKYRRNFPNSAYLSIPSSLQATWCHALGMNCPKRNLYVCEEHINIEEDCFRNKGGKLQLKKTARLILTKTYDESEMHSDKSNVAEGALDSSKDLLQFLQHGSMPYSKCDFSTQTHVKFANKTILMKPAVKSVGCMANIRVTHIAEKVMPSRPSSLTASHSTGSSQYEPSSSPISSSPTKDLAREKDVAAHAYLLKIIKENPKMYVRVPKQYYWLIDFLAKKCNLRPLHIIITLFKLKQNETFQRMSHFVLI